MSGLAPDFPTDRWEESPDPGVGVDTIRLAGPTTDDLLEHLHFEHIERVMNYDTGEKMDWRQGGRSTLALGLASARVIGRRRGLGLTFEVEVSLPTMLRGHNRDPLHPDLLLDGVETALVILGEELPGVPGLDQVWLQRLDLARDFQGVRLPPLTLEALARRHIPRATVHSQYRRPDGQLQTIMRGSKTQWMLRGYAKGYALEAQATRTDDPRLRAALAAWGACSEHQLRYELQMRRPLLKKMGLMKMSDCTPENLDTVARKYYDLAGWSAPYGGSRIRDALLEILPSLQPADRRNLLAYLYAEGAGIDSELSRHPLERVRAIARRYDLLAPDDSSPTRRLDFETGREVLE